MVKIILEFCRLRIEELLTGFCGQGLKATAAFLLGGGPLGGLPRQSLGTSSPSLHTANSFGFLQSKQFSGVSPDFPCKIFPSCFLQFILIIVPCLLPSQLLSQYLIMCSPFYCRPYLIINYIIPRSYTAGT